MLYTRDAKSSTIQEMDREKQAHMQNEDRGEFHLFSHIYIYVYIFRIRENEEVTKFARVILRKVK